MVCLGRGNTQGGSVCACGGEPVPPVRGSDGELGTGRAGAVGTCAGEGWAGARLSLSLTL